jgi:hypothetical protein
MHFDDPQVLRVDVRIVPDEEADLVADRLRQVLAVAVASR